MNFDLNEEIVEELSIDEVDIYQHFEDQYRANEAFNDDVGVRENIYGWDLNVEALDELNAVQNEPKDVNGRVEGEIEPEDVLSDGDDEFHELRAPAVDDWFETLEEGCKYYELFGKQCGFGVFKRSNHKNKDLSQHYTLACSKCKKPKTSNEGRIPTRRRAYIGTGCKACIKLKNTDITGGWVVIEVNLDHNHVLQPESAFLISGYRYIPKRLQDLLDFHEEQGLAVSTNIDLVIKGAGGYLRCPFTKKDARNHIDKYRRNKLQALGGDDCHLIFEYFQNKQKSDRNFFYAYDCTRDSRLWNIFWADGRSRAAYKYFHDVIVLDATYLTNRYDMPLVLFVGINHHGHTIIFACALLGRESEEDYKWCMRRFLECMNNVKPGGVLTDQCPSIELGVRHVFGAETVHRYCSWHILHKLPTKWGQVANKSEKTKWIKSVVYDSQTTHDFEEKWVTLMDKVGKENDVWFKAIYAMRDKWVPAFLSTQFWAGMTTTQRVESMNAFLNRYLTRRESLKDFVHSFEEALGNIWQRENTADHDSKFRAHRVNSQLPMEYQYQSTYTNDIFLKVQEQFTLCMNLSCNLVEQQNGDVLYMVSDCWGSNFQVLYKRTLNEVFCICRLFQVLGILCSHCIQVLKHERIFCIDEKYIIDRWRKDINRENLTIIDLTHPTLPEQNRLYELTMSTNGMIQDLLNMGSLNEEMHDEVYKGLQDLRNKISANIGGQQNNNLRVNSGVDESAYRARKRRKPSTGKQKAKVVSTVEGEVPQNDTSSTAFLNETGGQITGTDCEATHEEVICDAILRGSQSSTCLDEQPTSTVDQFVNCPPSIPILPPHKSNRRGRPKKKTIKNALDIAIKKIIEKKKNMKKENITRNENQTNKAKKTQKEKTIQKEK